MRYIVTGPFEALACHMNLNLIFDIKKFESNPLSDRFSDFYLNNHPQILTGFKQISTYKWIWIEKYGIQLFRIRSVYTIENRFLLLLFF